jgi:hypothetical protein
LGCFQRPPSRCLWFLHHHQGQPEGKTTHIGDVKGQAIRAGIVRTLCVLHSPREFFNRLGPGPTCFIYAPNSLSKEHELTLPPSVKQLPEVRGNVQKMVCFSSFSLRPPLPYRNGGFIRSGLCRTRTHE